MAPEIVFLDRDGTINEDFGYVCSPEEVELIDGSSRAIASLKRSGFVVVIISNQSAIGRGLATEADVDATNDCLLRLLAAQDPDAQIDLVLYCPDHPDRAGRNRKPDIGLLDEVKRRWEVDPARCWMIGDKESDIRFGLNAGLPHAQCLLLRGDGDSAEHHKLPEELRAGQNIFSNLEEAVSHLLAQRK